MSYVALLGGYALKHRKTSIGHVFTNEISNVHHLSHGQGVSSTLYAVTRYVALACPEALEIVGRAIGVDTADKENLGKTVVAKFDEMLLDIGIKTLKEYGIDKEFVDDSMTKMETDGRWKAVPYHPDWDACRQALYEAVEI